jgi:DNA polymerase IIIc chi subunit
MIRTGQTNIQQARRAQEAILLTAVNGGEDLEAPMKLAILQNEIAQGEFSATVAVPIELTDSEKTQYNNEWRTYRERNWKRDFDLELL